MFPYSIVPRYVIPMLRNVVCNVNTRDAYTNLIVIVSTTFRFSGLFLSRVITIDSPAMYFNVHTFYLCVYCNDIHVHGALWIGYFENFSPNKGGFDCWQLIMIGDYPGKFLNLCIHVPNLMFVHLYVSFYINKYGYSKCFHYKFCLDRLCDNV